LTDCPSAYTGKASYNVRVNVSANGLEFIDPATQLYGLIHAASSKTTPVDADEFGIWDSVVNGLKKLTWANLKATLKTYFDTLYQVVLVSGTNIKTINSNSLLGSGNLTISGGSGTDDHTELSNLPWTTSGHTGTANRLMATGASGEAVELTDLFILEVNLSALDTDLDAVTGVAKFPSPEDMTIVSVFVQVTTAPTGSAAQWDINVEGSSILTDKIIIEAGEYSSLDATTQPSFTDANVDKGEDFIIDRDAVGATVAGQNDVLTILYRKR
jgi:hypothetical protein